MVTAAMTVRRAAATALLIAATFAVVAAYPHMHNLMARADSTWLAPLEVIAVDALALGSGLALAAGAARIWSAWLTVAFSIPVNLAVIVAPTEPLMGWLAGLWPAVVVALGCITFIRNRRRLRSRREGDQ